MTLVREGDKVEPIRLVIELNPTTGATNVTGPLGDKLIAYGLLEVARQIIQEYKPEAAAPVAEVPRIVPASVFPSRVPVGRG